jgi:hypothetical protein
MQFSPTSCHFISLRSKYSPQNPVIKHPQVCVPPLMSEISNGFFYPEDGGDTFLRNVGWRKIYTAPHPRRRHSSVSNFF